MAHIHAAGCQDVRLVVYTEVGKEKMFAGVCKLYIRKRIHCKRNDESGTYSSNTM
jgi:hypothetical protein